MSVCDMQDGVIPNCCTATIGHTDHPQENNTEHYNRTVGNHKAAPDRGEMKYLTKLEWIALPLGQQVSCHKYVDATRQGWLCVDTGNVMLAPLKRQACQLL